MKKFALGIVLGASLVSTAAVAGEQRPTYLAFKAPVAVDASVTPAAPQVKKRDGAFTALPLFVPLAGGLALLGLVVGLTTGGGDNNGSPG